MNAAHRLTHFIALALVGAGGCSQIDDRPAEWGYISPAIFQPNCATTSCHSPAAAVSGLDFSTPANGYASLTQLWTWVPFAADASTPPGTPCAIQKGTLVCEEKERPLVTPYDPDGSRVVNMLLARDAPRMPPDRPLPMADIELVERWILNGALEYPSGSSVVDAGAHDATRLTDAARDKTSDDSGLSASDAAGDRTSD